VSTVTVSRSGVTIEEVSAVLRATLGPRYTVTPSTRSTGFAKDVQGEADSMVVAANRLERANVRVVSGAISTEIQVEPGATYFGLIRLLDRVGIVRKVRHALEAAPELGEPGTSE